MKEPVQIKDKQDACIFTEHYNATSKEFVWLFT